MRTPAALALALLACDAAPAAPATSPPPAQTSQPAAPQLPPGDFPGLPGWLALATGPKERPAVWFTPQHPTAEAVIPTEPDFAAPVGTKLVAIAGDGAVEVTYAGGSTEPYGCEPTPTRYSGFDAPRKLPEGAVWLLPPGGRGSPIPVVAGPVEGGATPSRTFTAGPLRFVATRTSARAGELAIFDGDRRAASLPFDKHFMEGGDEGPLDLGVIDELGFPAPRWAFRLGEGEAAPIAVVLAGRGYEGEVLRVVARPKPGTVRVLERSVGLYHCAF